MTLYEISSEYKRLLDAIGNEEIPKEAIADTLESIEASIEDKADSIACLVKNLTSDTIALATEESHLAERRKAKERQIDSLKEYLSAQLLAIGKTKLETSRNKISFRKSKKLVVDNEYEFIQWAGLARDDLLKYSAPSIDRGAVKRAIAGGEAIHGARIEENQNIQIM